MGDATGRCTEVLWEMLVACVTSEGQRGCNGRVQWPASRGSVYTATYMYICTLLLHASLWVRLVACAILNRKSRMCSPFSSFRWLN